MARRLLHAAKGWARNSDRMGCWPGCLADFLPTGISLNCWLPGAALHAVVIMPIKTV
jgi:hypothetical protein